MALYRTGDGSDLSTVFCTLELVNNDWFKRALVTALESMCQEEVWEQIEVTNQSPSFARDKANEMLESLTFEPMNQTPVGTIAMFGTDVPPEKWLICNGDEVSRTTYADLFAVIGDAFGDGDGSTTFLLPNFTDKSPMGANGSYVPQAGNTYGEGTHVLTTAEMPSHNHAPNAPMTSFFGVRSSGGTLWPNTGGVYGVQSVTGLTGGGGSHNTVHPVLGVYFIIYAGV